MVINFKTKQPITTNSGELSAINGVAFTDLGNIQFVDLEVQPEVTRKDVHAAEPIKNRADIEKIQRHLISNGRYRDNLLFTMGIHVGLRCGDLRWTRVCGLVDENGNWRDPCYLIEEKTGKLRTFHINEEVKIAAKLYIDQLAAQNNGNVSMGQLLFKGEGNRSKSHKEAYRGGELKDAPLQVKSIERLLKQVINDECGIDVHASTHCLRKTFAYHMIVNAKDRPRAIEFLQKLFGHSSPVITLRYAGITAEEEKMAYENLSLGCLRELVAEGKSENTAKTEEMAG